MLRRSIFIILILNLFINLHFSSVLIANGREHRLKSFKIDCPEFGLSNVPFSITISAIANDGSIDTSFVETVTITGIYRVLENKKEKVFSTGNFDHGKVILKNVLTTSSGKSAILVRAGDISSEVNITTIPGFFSLLPPILAIVFALLFKQVLLALFCGVWLGAIFLNGYNPLIGFMRTLDTYIVHSLANPSHTAIVIFSMTLGGMVGVISKDGGAQGIVQKLSRFADSRRGGQIATWAMGVFIFFDDYANTLIVGNTMRPFTDKLRISREKLSYIVDSTAAPVASIAIISSWVGFQIGLIDQAFKAINFSQDSYITFLRSIPYASYSVLAIFFVFMVGFTLRDVFSMYRAENRTFSTGKVLRDNAQPLADVKSLDIHAEKGTPLRWYNAMFPILVVIVVTIMGLYYNGLAELGDKAANARLGEIIGAANSFDVLMWASFTGALLAIILAVSQKILSLTKALEAWLNGVKAMVIAMIILILAWSIGNICLELKTADYVINITKGFLSPHYLPLLTFIVAAFIGFATGTSWATMAILVPIVIPAGFKLSSDAGIEPSAFNSIMLGTIGAVLSGSVFGDHCSPISDTTIMSSMASAADHVDHVRTQLPYAILVAIVACLVGYLPAGFGLNVWFSIIAGIIVLIIFLFIFGKKIY